MEEIVVISGERAGGTVKNLPSEQHDT